MSVPLPSLPAQEIEEILDRFLEAEFTFRDSSETALVISGLPRSEQDYILTWVERVANAHTELAHQFSQRVVDLLKHNDRRVMEAWARHAMDVYDQTGLRPALEVLCNADDLEKFSQSGMGDGSGAVLLQEELGVLQPFVYGLSGRKLKLTESDAVYTDTETIYLPAFASRFPVQSDNFLVYKAMVAFHWAQNRFGVFRVRLSPLLEEAPPGFIDLLFSMETLRLEACLRRELPGLYREMTRLKEKLGEDKLPARWERIAPSFEEETANIHRSIQLAERSYGELDPLPTPFYAGKLLPEKAEAVQDARLEREKKELRMVLRRVAEDLKLESPDGEDEKSREDGEESGKEDGEESGEKDPRFSARKVPDPSVPEGYRVEITLEDAPVPLPEEVNALTTSIVQDLGEIPDDYLTPAGSGEFDPNFAADPGEEAEAEGDASKKKVYQEDGPFFCNEWDYRRQHYHKNWCSIWEKPTTPTYDKFVEETMQKYSGLVKHLRRTFEAMRDEDRLLKRQHHGDDVDIDALVEALAESRDGREMSDRLFTRMHRAERNIAVMFMIDMSGSTKGWINEAIRESLLLLCEALESLGDRYAIYGFSGMKRTRCVAFRIKDFKDRYNEEVRARISGIRPQDYTRMGFAIRHLGKKLLETEAKKRILIAISDGKPEDWDRYRGEYSIEDTRRALIEARRDGIHPYCITIDSEAHDYLPHLFGGVNYTFIDDVRKLPLKVSDIYRRLTV